MDQISIFRKALENPLEVSEEDFQGLIAKYSYCQPLVFARERKRAILGEAVDKHAALIYAYSPFWLKDYLAEPIKEIPELEVEADDYVPFEDLDLSSLSEDLPKEATPSLEEELEESEQPSLEENFEADDASVDAAATQKENITSETGLPAEEPEDSEPVFQMPPSYDIEKEFATIEPESSEDTKQETAEVSVSEQVHQDAEALAPENSSEPKAHAGASQEDISLYNDELMPYSFRWWLYKTRLEHADTYQPFASPELPRPKAGQVDFQKIDEAILDQQIRENIFHLQNPEDKLSEASGKQRTTIEFGIGHKGEEVIERFIREEPQIQPLKADELNTENKARRSSEDHLQVVTETLADIYIAQGMYERAVGVFKKLIADNPEKKSYFAGRIREIEQKL